MIFTVSDLTYSWYWEVDRLVIKCWHSVDQVSIDYLQTYLMKPKVNLVWKTNLGNSPLSGCDWWKLTAQVQLQRLEAWLMTTQPSNRAPGQKRQRLQWIRSIYVNWQTFFPLIYSDLCWGFCDVSSWWKFSLSSVHCLCALHVGGTKWWQDVSLQMVQV